MNIFIKYKFNCPCNFFLTNKGTTSCKPALYFCLIICSCFTFGSHKKFVLDSFGPTSLEVVDPSFDLVDPTLGLVDQSFGLVDQSFGLGDQSFGLVDPNSGLVDPNSGLVDLGF